MSRLPFRAIVLALTAVLPTATIIGVGGKAIAQEQQKDYEYTPGTETTLPTIVIYGSNRLRATTIDDSVTSVTVLTREHLSKSPAVDLPAFLRTQPGVSIQQNGGQGSNSTVALRGTSAAQTLVVIDGVRVSSATTGAANLANIPLDNIERIEIIRGPRSAIYGSDAIGGVVYIFTKQGVNCPEGRTSCATLTAGVQTPFGGYLDGQVEGRTDTGLTYNFGGRIFGTEGYNFTYPTPGPWGVNEPDKDGFVQGSLRGRVAQSFDWGTLTATGTYSRGLAEFDNSPGFENLNFSEVAALSVAGDVYHDASWKSHLEATFGMDKSKTYRDDVPGFQASEFDTYRYGLLGSTTKTFDTGPIFHTLVVGGEIYREQVRSTVDFDQDARDLLAGYVQYQADSGPWTLALAGRVDHNSQFGTEPTYNVGLGYRATDWLKLRASYGTGFRTPTFNDLYYPGFSNPDLNPETSQTVEVGATFTPWDGTSLDIAAYHTRIDDMIAYDPARWNVYNINQAEISGIEVALSLTSSRISSLSPAPLTSSTPSTSRPATTSVTVPRSRPPVKSATPRLSSSPSPVP